MKEANCIMAITIITELATMSALPFDLPILYVMDNSRKRKEEFARLNRRLDKGDWKGHICMCMDFSRGASQRYQGNDSYCEVIVKPWLFSDMSKPIPKVNLVPRPKHNTAFVGFTRVNNQGEQRLPVSKPAETTVPDFRGPALRALGLSGAHSNP
ncbi:hypothetical protein TNCV_635451 [Trichonephila clavipes]|nr:hypothetical protein TNCV_635451 [Trichonephila clavipes]